MHLLQLIESFRKSGTDNLLLGPDQRNRVLWVNTLALYLIALFFLCGTSLAYYAQIPVIAYAAYLFVFLLLLSPFLNDYLRYDIAAMLLTFSSRLSFLFFADHSMAKVFKSYKNPFENCTVIPPTT